MAVKIRLRRMGSRNADFYRVIVQDSRRAPTGKFIETYILKRGFLDGLPGLIISVNAAHSIFLKFAYLTEDRIQAKRKNE